MNLDDVPAGARILIDANILIYARRGMSAQCCRLLAAARRVRSTAC